MNTCRIIALMWFVWLFNWMQINRNWINTQVLYSKFHMERPIQKGNDQIAEIQLTSGERIIACWRVPLVFDRFHRKCGRNEWMRSISHFATIELDHILGNFRINCACLPTEWIRIDWNMIINNSKLNTRQINGEPIFPSGNCSKFIIKCCRRSIHCRCGGSICLLLRNPSRSLLIVKNEWMYLMEQWIVY